MADIAAILQQLPDDEARLRVMRWAFGRFSTEFKRPITVPVTAVAPAASAPAPLRAVPRPAPPPEPVAEALTAEPVTADFGQQISELNDLFPEREEAAADAERDLWPA